MKELVIEAKQENLDAVLAFVDEQLEAADCPRRAWTQIDIAVEEVFVNIAHYAYVPETGTATIRTRISEEPRAMTLTFLDRGIPYDPLAREDPDIALPADERPIGGLGVYMVKKIMDEAFYAYRDGQNILTLKKAF